MMPQAEARSLAENPLPITDLDKYIPSQIAGIDNEINALNDKIAGLQVSRRELLEKAISNSILEDDHYRIDHVVKKIRSLNISKFKAYFTEEYDQIVALQKKQALEKAEGVIPLATAERFVNKMKLANTPGMFEITERESWNVVKKEVA
jgi:thymidylate synthase ThyX